MDLVSLYELRQINWIKNSDFISSMTEDDEDIVIDRQLIIQDNPDKEPLDIVYKAINFFGGEPSNFLDYIRKQKEENFDKLLIDRPKNEHGYINKLKEFSSKQDYKISEWAAEKGYLEILKYCRSKKYPFHKDTCSYLAKGGYLDCLKYAHKKGCPWDESTCSGAATGGHLDCLQYARENGCPWDENNCSYAAGAGHLDCLDYAYKTGLCSYRYVCSFAAGSDHLNCLKYSVEHHFPLDKHTCYAAAKGGHLNCLKYAIDLKCPYDKKECLEIAKDRVITNYLNQL